MRRHRPKVSQPNYQGSIFIPATYIPYPQTGEDPDSANCWHYPTKSSNGLLRTNSANFWHYPDAPHTLSWQFNGPWSHHDRIRYPSFCRTFCLFWHSQTTNDNYLGVEINKFVKNSIDSGAASAGWSCFANVEEKILLRCRANSSQKNGS